MRSDFTRSDADSLVSFAGMAVVVVVADWPSALAGPFSLAAPGNPLLVGPVKDWGAASKAARAIRWNMAYALAELIKIPYHVRLRSQSINTSKMIRMKISTGSFIFLSSPRYGLARF